MTSDIDECSADPSPCDSNADCTNTDGSYSCTCTPGYTGDGSTCQGRSISIYKSIILKEMWKIRSVLDYFRVNCCFVTLSPDIDECSAEASPCDLNADCINTDGSYSCTCQPGFTGDGATCRGMFKARQINK